MEIVLILLTAVLGAVMYRVRGVGNLTELGLSIDLPLPKIVRLVLCGGAWAIPFLIFSWVHYAVAMVAFMVLLSPGHGAYYNLGRNPSSVDKHETMWAWFTKWFQEKTGNRVLTEYVGLGLTGLVNTLPFGGIGLALKPIAYHVGWTTGKGTDTAEWVYGLLVGAWGTLMVVLYAQV